MENEVEMSVGQRFYVLEKKLDALQEHVNMITEQINAILDELSKREPEMLEARPDDIAQCKFCKEERAIRDMHRHDSGYVCPECWDDRLKNTE